MAHLAPTCSSILEGVEPLAVQNMSVPCHMFLNSGGNRVEFVNEDGRVVHGRTRSRKSPKPKVSYVQYDASDESDTGQLQPIAARVLMKILYAARMCRFDLLRAVCVLAQRVTKWDATCDRRLHRLICYIHGSLGKRLVGWVGDSTACVRPHLYTDADLAGCADTQRSTTGVFHCVTGPHTSFPIAAVSKRQGSVSHSTPEAELVALDHGIRHVGMPACEIWSRIVENPKIFAHEDNSVAIRIVHSGRNQTMHHLGRTHGISTAWLHEAYSRGEFDLRFEPSSTMAADVFTKAFSNVAAWDAACSLVNICDGSEVQNLVDCAGVPPPCPQGGGKRGLWQLNADGSGTWTRIDTAAVKFRTLYMAGPKLSEITKRETWDATTGELLDTTRNFATCKAPCEDLPEPRPRALRTVFHFERTSANVPASAHVEAANQSLDKACGHASATPAPVFVLRLSDWLN